MTLAVDGDAHRSGAVAERRTLNAMTVDVEDYYQVSAFEHVVDRSTWDDRESRVVASTETILALFAEHGTRATFFVLGWVAERHPALVRSIRDQGHEVASHGYEHRLVRSMTPEAFRDDLRRASDAIESAAGCRVQGFRAPSFSIDKSCWWAFDVLREEGYAYSSSVFPVTHDRYGVPDFPRFPTVLQGEDGRSLWEFPMTTWRVLGRNLPAAGGGWLRLFPAPVTHRVIRRLNRDGRPGIVYLHPWEVDPEQPEVDGIGGKTRWRHRLNLHRVAGRLDGLLKRFRFGTVVDVLGLKALQDPAAGTRRPGNEAAGGDAPGP